MNDIEILGDLEVDFVHKTTSADPLSARLKVAFDILFKRSVISRVQGIIFKDNIFKLKWVERKNG